MKQIALLLRLMDKKLRKKEKNEKTCNFIDVYPFRSCCRGAANERAVSS